jgi:8-oxo-dGTP pyrophosphatase MutT (NUDIX family)
MTNRIIVVSAAIVNVQAKRLFVQRRSGETKYPWHWCTPGGHVEPNEPEFHTLCRELREEHGVRVKDEALGAGKLVYEHDVAGKVITVRCYSLPHDMIDGQYVAGDLVAGFDWVSANELETLMLTPADHANRDKLLDLIR